MQLNLIEYRGFCRFTSRDKVPGIDIWAYKAGQRFDLYVYMAGKDLRVALAGIFLHQLTHVKGFGYIFNPTGDKITIRDQSLNYSVVKTIESSEGEYADLQFKNAVLGLHAIPGIGVFVSKIQEFDTDAEALTGNFT